MPPAKRSAKSPLAPLDPTWAPVTLDNGVRLLPGAARTYTPGEARAMGVALIAAADDADRRATSAKEAATNAVGKKRRAEAVVANAVKEENDPANATRMFRRG